MNRATRRAQDKQETRAYRLRKRQGSPARKVLHRHRSMTATTQKGKE
jgi:hypothetical protein